MTHLEVFTLKIGQNDTKVYLRHICVEIIVFLMAAIEIPVLNILSLTSACANIATPLKRLSNADMVATA